LISIKKRTGYGFHAFLTCICYFCCLFSVRYRCIWGWCGHCGRCGVSWQPLTPNTWLLLLFISFGVRPALGRRTLYDDVVTSSMTTVIDDGVVDVIVVASTSSSMTKRNDEVFNTMSTSLLSQHQRRRLRRRIIVDVTL